MNIEPEARMFGPQAFKLLRQYAEEFSEDPEVKKNIHEFLIHADRKFYKEIDPYCQRRKKAEVKVEKAQKDLDSLSPQKSTGSDPDDYIPETYLG
jgi:hypothetical protein